MKLKRWLPLIGWGFSIAAAAMCLMSARWKYTFDPWYVSEWKRLGWNPDLLPRIAILQATCVALYLTPPTAVLGVVLLTGYLGGALSQYARLEEPIPLLVPLTTALCAWFGLWLREDRLRSLLPLRRKTSAIVTRPEAAASVGTPSLQRSPSSHSEIQ